MNEELPRLPRHFSRQQPTFLKESMQRYAKRRFHALKFTVSVSYEKHIPFFKITLIASDLNQEVSVLSQQGIYQSIAFSCFVDIINYGDINYN